jgi:anti-anti-sigma factor
MFSAGYWNNLMVINTINVRRISFQNIEKLRTLVLQVLKNPCTKIIFDLKGVKFIDSASFSIIDELVDIARRHSTTFVFANIDEEVQELFELIPP